MVKAILFKLQRHFAIDHLYSSDRYGVRAFGGAGADAVPRADGARRGVWVIEPGRPGKLWCFQQIEARFGPLAAYTAIGDGDEERWAAGEVRRSGVGAADRARHADHGALLLVMAGG